MSRSVSWLVRRAPAPTTPIGSNEIVAVLAAHFVITGFCLQCSSASGSSRLWRGWRLSHAGILAAVLFMVAHVKFSPFSVEMWQLGASSGLLVRRVRPRAESPVGSDHGNGDRLSVG
jgi:hypothetical protein